MTSPFEGAGSGDPAAEHARQLLHALACERPIDDRPDAAGPALEWARSGAMILTGEADGPPRFAAGALATAARGAGLALAALAPGCDLVPLDAPALLGERAAAFGLARRGRTACGGSARLLPLADGEIALNLPRADDWRLLPAWLEHDLPAIETERDWAAVERALCGRSMVPLVERGREIGLAVAPAIALPGSDAHATGATTPPCFRLSAATHGRTGDATGAGGGGSITASRPRAPRVLDLSTLWAGPLAGSLLVAAGCDVLKVESPRRPDGARAGDADFFALLNAGKRSAALDLAASRDREVFAALLAEADVVLESARPRALAQLGFDARGWVAARPGRIWASITGYGREHEWIAFGDDAAVAAGLAYDPAGSAHGRVARRGDRPLGAGSAIASPRFGGDAIADPLTGLHAAVAILALLATGRGGLLALSLADVAAHAAYVPDAAPAACAAPDGARGRDAHAAPIAQAGARTADALTLPLTQRDGRWTVWNGSGWEEVAPARARTARAPGPPLVPPEPATLARWRRGC
ncbi:MAG: CoA transferase [Myxococcota bacterium]